MKEPVWNGTPDEIKEYLVIVDKHCHHSPEGSHCRYDGQGRMTKPCDSHTAMAKDQRMLDGLVVGRRMVALLLAEEFDIALTPDAKARLRHAINN